MAIKHRKTRPVLRPVRSQSRPEKATPICTTGRIFADGRIIELVRPGGTDDLSLLCADGQKQELNYKSAVNIFESHSSSDRFGKCSICTELNLFSNREDACRTVDTKRIAE
jgi:hypothetical protein